MSKLISNELIDTPVTIINKESNDDSAVNAYDNPTADIEIINYENLVIDNSSNSIQIPFHDYDNYEYFAIDLMQRDLNGLKIGSNGIKNPPTKKNFLSMAASTNIQDQTVSHITYDSLLSADSNSNKTPQMDLVNNSNSEQSFIIYDEDIIENDWYSQKFQKEKNFFYGIIKFFCFDLY